MTRLEKMAKSQTHVNCGEHRLSAGLTKPWAACHAWIFQPADCSFFREPILLLLLLHTALHLSLQPLPRSLCKCPPPLAPRGLPSPIPRVNVAPSHSHRGQGHQAADGGFFFHLSPSASRRRLVPNKHLVNLYEARLCPSGHFLCRGGWLCWLCDLSAWRHRANTEQLCTTPLSSCHFASSLARTDSLISRKIAKASQNTVLRHKNLKRPANAYCGFQWH